VAVSIRTTVVKGVEGGPYGPVRTHTDPSPAATAVAPCPCAGAGPTSITTGVASTVVGTNRLNDTISVVAGVVVAVTVGVTRPARADVVTDVVELGNTDAVIEAPRAVTSRDPESPETASSARAIVVLPPVICRSAPPPPLPSVAWRDLG
jgi:hypothetical protein